MVFALPPADLPAEVSTQAGASQFRSDIFKYTPQQKGRSVKFKSMSFHDDIIRLSKQNAYFRQVLATGAHSQVVVMSIPPGGDIGEEVHDVDQILVFVGGAGRPS